MQDERHLAYMSRRLRETNMIKNSKKSIWVKFQKEGIHKYPAALDDPKLATGEWDDVSFLGYPHRHMFHFRVSIEVFHDDREIEFIQFSRWLQRLYTIGTDDKQSSDSTQVLNLDYKSCEMISDELAIIIKDKYPNRDLTIEISEDDENGSSTFYSKDN
jgi:hypothetical protein